VNPKVDGAPPPVPKVEERQQPEKAIDAPKEKAKTE
jgi:hypothetical protein